MGKELTEPWDDGTLANLKQRLDWLLQSPGLGLLTGEPGVGKTAAGMCKDGSITSALNPHRYLVLYQAETDFGRVDIYRGLARALCLEPSYRRAQLWRDIKQRVHELVDTRQVTPLWIIDEAQNLPSEFFRDFPAFLNFAFDSRDLISVWLIGHPAMAQTLDRAPYAAPVRTTGGVVLGVLVPTVHLGVPHCLGSEYRSNCRGKHRLVRTQIGWGVDSKLARAVTLSGKCRHSHPHGA